MEFSAEYKGREHGIAGLFEAAFFAAEGFWRAIGSEISPAT